MKKHSVWIALVLPLAFLMCGCKPEIKNVNPDATSQAITLLDYIYGISGQGIISGQHNYNDSLTKYSERVEALAGEKPALWGADFIWLSGPDNRQAVVDEAIRQYSNGTIITLMWHVARPMDEERPQSWKSSVQGELTGAEWKELTTPGTALYEKWQAQADEIASYLLQLKDAGVPVLWRPYHEMNGIWFWWGDKKGDDGYVKLWRMMFDRYVNHHKLNNLIWVWNANAPRDRENDEAYAYADYFPGLEYVDVLAADVYHNDYRHVHHDQLLELAQGKPIALGEVGRMPTVEIIEQQPQWSWFMVWSRWINTHNDPENVRQVYDLEYTVTKDELPVDLFK
ncbi:MAG: glycosyl hydrolase [Candidatus Cyclobacteriaceae bacterium M3_2C_046]